MYKLAGTYLLHLWDCGGQDAFQEMFLLYRRKETLSNVRVLIHVFSIDRRLEIEEDMDWFKKVIQALLEYSPHAKVVVLVNKIDLVETQSEKETYIHWYRESVRQIEEELNFKIVIFYCTSIFDSTLFIGWTAVMKEVLPDTSRIKILLAEIAKECNCRYAFVFDKNTALELSHFVESESNSSTGSNVAYKRETKAREVSENATIMLSNERNAGENSERGENSFTDWVIEIGNMKRIFKILTQDTIILLHLEDKDIKAEFVLDKVEEYGPKFVSAFLEDARQFGFIENKSQD